MSPTTYDPTLDPRCLPLGDDPVSNVDMNGTAVAVASVIVNFCLRLVVTLPSYLGIMVTWSPGDVDVGIQTLLIQLYSILLSTLLSVNRQQLSRHDALFALTLSSSPLTVYLVAASICDLFGIHTGLYKRIKSHRLIIRTFGALLLLIWAGLSMTRMMSATAFKDSSCNTGTFVDWLWYIVGFLMYFLMLPGGVGDVPGPAWVIIIPWVVCLARRWSQVREDVKLRPEAESRLRVFCTWVRCAWCIIGRNHKWYIYCLFAYLDICWAFQIIIYAYFMSGDKYVLSYGQILSVFFAVPTLVSTAKLVYFHRSNLLHFLRRLPRLCLAEARYLLTGKESGPTVQDNHLPFNVTPHPERPVPGKPRDQIVMNVRPAHQLPLLPELDYAMRGGR